LKINNLGEEEWSLALPISNPSGNPLWWPGGMQIEVTDNGDFICFLIGENNIFNVSIDGTLISSTNIPFMPKSMNKTNDGNIIIVGENGIIKINNSLEVLWYQIYSPELSLKSIYPLSNEGFIVYGNMDVGKWSEDIILMKIDAFGNEVWSQTNGQIAIYDWGGGDKIIQLFNNSFVYISGYDVGKDPNVNSDIINIDESGQELWIEIDNLNAFNSLASTTDNGFVAVGYQSSNDPFWDWYGDLIVSKFDFNGNQEWVQTFGGENTDWGHFVNQTNDGGYIISGLKEVIHEAEYEQYIIKLNADGTLSSEFTIPTPSSKRLQKVVDALGREVNHIPNQILFNIYDDGSVEKKFVVE